MTSICRMCARPSWPGVLPLPAESAGVCGADGAILYASVGHDADGDRLSETDVRHLLRNTALDCRAAAIAKLVLLEMVAEAGKAWAAWHRVSRQTDTRDVDVKLDGALERLDDGLRRLGGTRREPIDDLIAASSLGSPGAVAVRSRTDPATVERILARVAELDAAADGGDQ